MRTRNPLVVQRDGFEQQIAHLVAKHPAPAGTGRETISARAQRVILAEGHDSVIVKLGPNWDHDYLVALRGEDVRIVVRDPADPRPQAATKVTLTQPPTTTTGT